MMLINPAFSGPFEIHTDTAVSLSVKQVELLLCLPMGPPSSSSSPCPLGLIHVSALGLGLVAAAGLDRDPEISIFQLGVGQACGLTNLQSTGQPVVFEFCIRKFTSFLLLFVLDPEVSVSSKLVKILIECLLSDWAADELPSTINKKAVMLSVK